MRCGAADRGSGRGRGAGAAGCAARAGRRGRRRTLAMARWAALRVPAAIFGLLLLWGGLSALWAIEPARSLMLEIRLAGLFAAAIALAAAARSVADPRRLAFLTIAGTALGLVVAWMRSRHERRIQPIMSRCGPSRRRGSTRSRSGWRSCCCRSRHCWLPRPHGCSASPPLRDGRDGVAARRHGGEDRARC